MKSKAMELAKNLNRKAFRFGIFWNPVRSPGSLFALDRPRKSVEFGLEGRGLAYGPVWGSGERRAMDQPLEKAEGGRGDVSQGIL